MRDFANRVNWPGRIGKRRALVVGAADCVGEDLAEFARFGSQDVFIVAVNQAFRFLSRFDIWATLHPENLEGWIADARLCGHSLPECVIAAPRLDDEDVRGWPSLKVASCVYTLDWDFSEGNSGSSGLFGARVAIALGCDRVVLAGVPMDHRSHLGRTTPWVDRDRFTAAWSAAEPWLNGRVRSMSGWTRELLGEPDMQWWRH